MSPRLVYLYHADITRAFSPTRPPRKARVQRTHHGVILRGNLSISYRSRYREVLPTRRKARVLIISVRYAFVAGCLFAGVSREKHAAIVHTCNVFLVFFLSFFLSLQCFIRLKGSTACFRNTNNTGSRTDLHSAISHADDTQSGFIFLTISRPYGCMEIH